jgi:hypothetical protein
MLRQPLHSWDYVTEAATQKTGEKASKMGILFFRKTLTAVLSLAVTPDGTDPSSISANFIPDTRVQARLPRFLGRYAKPLNNAGTPSTIRFHSTFRCGAHRVTDSIS